MCELTGGFDQLELFVSVLGLLLVCQVQQCRECDCAVVWWYCWLVEMQELTTTVWVSWGGRRVPPGNATGLPGCCRCPDHRLVAPRLLR